MFNNVKTKAGAAIAAAAFVAGMMPAAAFATQPDPSWEYSSGSTEGVYNDSHPYTDLYLLGNDEYPLPTESNLEAAQANFAVNVPTRINYVLSPTTYASTDPEAAQFPALERKKKILGPDDVTLTNYSGINAHVSDLSVLSEGSPFTLVPAANVGGNIDSIFLQMNGEDLSRFVDEYDGQGQQIAGHVSTPTAGHWNIAAEDTFGGNGGPQVTGPGELSFGTSGAWGDISVDPTRDQYIGKVQFTIAPGTATANNGS